MATSLKNLTTRDVSALGLHGTFNDQGETPRVIVPALSTIEFKDEELELVSVAIDKLIDKGILEVVLAKPAAKAKVTKPATKK